MNNSSIGVYEVEKEFILGKGNFGTVWKGKCRGQDVAIKILEKQVLEPEVLESFRREVEIISSLRHPNVVQFMGACYVPGNFMIITEYTPKGDLEDMLLNPRIELSLFTRMKMARDIALGMNWLHLSSPQFVHRDLKTKNLLIDGNNRIKICDFGLSQIKTPGVLLQDPSGKAKGTPLWMAPEVLVGKKFNEKCDVYGFGIILWCLLTRKEPFTEFNDYNIFVNAIVNGRVRPPIPDDCEPSLRQLIKACWDHDPSVRPSFDAIIKAIENVIIDVAIKDQIGREFWKSEFFGKENILMDDFIETFKNYLSDYSEEMDEDVPALVSDEKLRHFTDFQLYSYSIHSLENSRKVSVEFDRRYGGPLEPVQLEHNDELSYRCLRELLHDGKVPTEGTERGGEQTSLERFGLIISNFGPIMDENRRVLILDKIKRMLYHTWFHGDIDKNQAENLISSQVSKPGTYLVRFSSVPGVYTLSSSTEYVVEHRRITYNPAFGYRIADTNFYSLEKLIRTAAGPLNLTNPCPGSRFTSLFMKGAVGGYVQSGLLDGYSSTFPFFNNNNADN